RVADDRRDAGCGDPELGWDKGIGERPAYHPGPSGGIKSLLRKVGLPPQLPQRAAITRCAADRTAEPRHGTHSARHPLLTYPPRGNHYALAGYALADALVAAIKSAGSTDGPKIAQALFGGKVSVSYFGSTMKFTDKCHRPQPAVYSIEQFTNGKDKQIDSWKVKSIPDIKDGSPCSGKPPSVGTARSSKIGRAHV